MKSKFPLIIANYTTNKEYELIFIIVVPILSIIILVLVGFAIALIGK